MQTQTTASKPTKTTTTPKKPVIIPDTEIVPATAPTAITTETEQRAIEAALGDTVATQTMPTTPIPDSIGDEVIFRLQHNGQELPGWLTCVYGTEDRKADVTVLTRGTLDFPEGAPGSLGVLPVPGASHGFEAGNWYKRTEKA